MNFKKTAAFLTALSMVTIPFSYAEISEFNPAIIACASETGVKDELTYQKFADHIEIISCEDTAESIVIPSEIDNKPVTVIGYEAFSNCTALEKVTIPDTVTSIEEGAFRYCKSLTSVTIPEKVTILATNTFYQCTSLTELNLPAGMIKIQSYALSNCTSLKTLHLPDSLRTLSDSAFSSEMAFDSITLSSGNQYFQLNDGVLTDRSAQTIYKCVTSKKGAYTIPETVTKIAAGAFYNCAELTAVTVNSKITSIPSYAFRNCVKLAEVNLPESVSRIDYTAFRHIAPDAVVTIENPYCDIGFGTFQTENYINEDGKQQSASRFMGTIRGYENSTAQTYAEDDKANFESLGVSTMEPPSSATSTTYATTAMYTTTKVASATTSKTNTTTSRTTSDGVFSYSKISVNDAEPTISITGVLKPADSITLPSEIEGLPVTAISSSAFSGTSIKSITIPEGVTSIGASAFFHCENLTNVSLPSTLKYINYGAFKACPSLKEIVLPEGLQSISGRAFEGTGITGITIPGSVEHVTGFYGCSALKNVVIQEGTKIISSEAFTCCRALESVKLPDTLTQISSYAFASCDALAEINLPESLTEISSYAFASCISLKSVIIPDSVTSLQTSAFQRCSSLTSVQLPATLKSLNRYVFLNCTALEEITLPEGLESLYMNAFAGTALKEITIPASLKSFYSLGNSYYSSNGISTADIYDFMPKLENIYVADGNPNYVSIDGILVSESSYSSSIIMFPPARTGYYTIPSGISDANTNSFWSSQLTGITLPRNFYISSGIFASCPNLEIIEVSASNNYYYDSNNALYYKLNSYSSSEETEPEIRLVSCPRGIKGEFVVPEGVTEIGNGAFRNCTGLTSIVLPSTLKTISSGAFHSCTGLTGITIPDSVEIVGSSAFQNCTALEEISLPDDAKFSYTYTYADNSTGSTNYYNNIFSGCTSLKKVKLPANLENIPSNTFYGCSALTTVTMPAALKTIDSNAFYQCGALSLTIPEGAVSIASSAFAESGLTDITIADTVTSIGYGAFSNCKDLKTAKLPAGISRIDSRAFNGCSSLEAIEIPEGVLEILSYAFRDCSALSSVTLPESLINIYQSAFSNCSALEEIYIPSNVSGIEQIVETTATTTATDSYGSNYTTAKSTTTAVKTVVTNDDTPNIPSHAGAFPNCTSLQKITVSKDNKYYADIDGVLMNKDSTELRQYPTGRKGAYLIPDSVTAIAYGAFENSAISEVTIPGTVSQISSRAFSNCQNLTKVTFPDNLEMISAYMFYNCTALENVVFPDTLKSVNYSAFANTGLTSVTLPKSVEKVLSYAFGACANLKSVTFLNPTGSVSEAAVSGKKAASEPYVFVSDTPEIDREYYSSSAVSTNTAVSVGYDYTADITIAGYDDSEAQRLADVHDYTFKSLGEGGSIMTTTTTTTETTTTTTVTETETSDTETTTTETTTTVTETETSASEETETETNETQTEEPKVYKDSYEYDIKSNENAYFFSSDDEVLTADKLITSARRRAIEEDGSFGEWEDIEDISIFDFGKLSPAVLFQKNENTEYSGEASAEVTITLPDGSASVQKVTMGNLTVGMTGDADGDGAVTASDAGNILIYAADFGAGKTTAAISPLKPERESLAMFISNVDKSDAVNATDASYILVYAAMTGAGNEAKWSEIVNQE